MARAWVVRKGHPLGSGRLGGPQEGTLGGRSPVRQLLAHSPNCPRTTAMERLKDLRQLPLEWTPRFLWVTAQPRWRHLLGRDCGRRRHVDQDLDTGDAEAP